MEVQTKWLKSLSMSRDRKLLSMQLCDKRSLRIVPNNLRTTYPEDGGFCLYTTASSGWVDILRLPESAVSAFLEELLSFDEASVFHYTETWFLHVLLMQVCEKGDLGSVQAILSFYRKHDAGNINLREDDPGSRFLDPITPLYNAALSGHANIVSALLLHGASLDFGVVTIVTTDGKDRTCGLAEAVILSDLTDDEQKQSVLEVLVQANAPVDRQYLFRLPHPERVFTGFYPDISIDKLQEQVACAKALGGEDYDLVSSLFESTMARIGDVAKPEIHLDEPQQTEGLQ